MQSMQRSFGKLWSKGPGDNAKFSVLLTDYEDADKVLAALIDNARLWRDSWASLVSCQLQIVTDYEGLYDPIVGATDGHGREAVMTPRTQLERSFRLKQVYADLKTELVEEIAMIEARILKPATEARDCIAPLRKTIKKRENKRLDYEKLQDKVSKLHRKPGRSAKEDAALAKTEEELSRAADEFNIADEHLRGTLPPIITATFNLVPPLLSALVLLQNRLLGLYYTTLHGYCEEFGFPSPPPPMSEVIATWSAAFKPVQSEVESINCIARGKAIHQPMNLTNDTQPRTPGQPMIKEGFRRTSSGLIGSSNNGPQPRTLRLPSTGPTPEPSPQPSPAVGRRPDYLAPTDFTTATVLGGTSVDRGANNRNQRPTSSSTDVSTTPSTMSSYGQNGFVKKKPPPPPPPKRIQSARPPPEEWVTALFAFTGQGSGDLSFSEGDRIKIVKKTDTDQDWWVGELNGRKGSFPANYCKPSS
ncbi:hypothetical protein B0H66DRAFT_467393 [Apodospora peruviana]|uniref:SH3 domain signaling protein n=1 Tax=Apodospora peruviana TaxID=516989 RepID=A0AAE0IU48_9PEZI|nr:hypothetical protein B0H66DRAFT_467393 [Apodospora peruviana]